MSVVGWTLAAVLAAAASRPPTVTEIMARVAANQQAASDARRHFVYRQEQTIRMRRPNGKLAREQQAEYAVAPGTQGMEKTLAKFQGKYERNGSFISYDQPRYEYKELDLDGSLIQDIAGDMMDDQKARDGIGIDLFPLTAEEQQKYQFRLVGQEIYRGRPAYRVAFTPRRDAPRDEDHPLWKGEALIDAAELQPVTVFTSMAEKVPMWARVLFGTDIKGLGFSIDYRRFADGVWFPVSYGGEFAVRGLFFYRRSISVALVNRDFKRTDVQSTLAYAADDH